MHQPAIDRDALRLAEDHDRWATFRGQDAVYVAREAVKLEARAAASDREAADRRERAAVARALVERHKREHREALVALNDALLHGGAAIGDQVVVAASVYRVCSPDREALRLGSVIPDDEPTAEMPLPEEEPSEREEWTAQYCEAMKFPG